MLPLLRSVGILDPQRAQKVLEYPEFSGLNHELIVENLRDVPDPDNALVGLTRVLERRPDIRHYYEGDSLSLEAKRLLVILGISHAYTDWLVKDPTWVETVVGMIPAQLDLHGPGFYVEEFEKLKIAYPDASDVDVLRKGYRQAIIGISLLDVESDMSEKLPMVCMELSDLAMAAIQIALSIAQEELEVQVPLAVIALGKCGARELNYLSDVDVMYVLADDQSEETLQQATEVAQRVQQIISGPGVEPPLFELDANLRPEGKDGPLVRTLESCKEYYTQWAHLWEYQALLKARPVAGDEEVGQAFTEFTQELVWSASEREGFLESMRHLRTRVVQHIPKDQADREIKLGRGGLRDIEFSAQLLQLVHGREDESLHDRDTLSALESLTNAGYISRHDGQDFIESYRFLRVLEHGTQLLKMKRTHLLPDKEDSLRHLSRLIKSELAQDTSSLPLHEKLLKKWKQTRLKVRSIHERLFFQPILDSLVQIKGDELKVALNEEGSLKRLEVLGYNNPGQAMSHIKALTQGVSRKVDIHRLLLPLFLRWFSTSVDPDKSLLNYRVISEQLGDSPWYLRMLRDSGAAAERLAKVLSLSAFSTQMLEHSPDAVAWFENPETLKPKNRAALQQEMSNTLSRHDDTNAAKRQLRVIYRRELLRVSISDTLDYIDPKQVMRALSDLYYVFLNSTVELAIRQVETDRGKSADFAVLAMGRLGGQEVIYGSDADVMYVYRALEASTDEQAKEYSLEVIKSLKNVLTGPVEPPLPGEKPLEVDANLRPEGKGGPMVRSLDSYAEYYDKWAESWEYQALLRCDGIAGDESVQLDFLHMIDNFRYPKKLATKDAQEIRRIKARVEGERLPRGADRNRHTKLGRGSLSDVEWLAQLIQLKHGGADSAFRTTETLPVYEHVQEVGLIPEHDIDALEKCWLLCSKVRSELRLFTGKDLDVLPEYGKELEGVARLCGWPKGGALEFEDHYLKITRRGRYYFEKWFYEI